LIAAAALLLAGASTAQAHGWRYTANCGHVTVCNGSYSYVTPTYYVAPSCNSGYTYVSPPCYSTAPTYYVAPTYYCAPRVYHYRSYGYRRWCR
jgi:hypothetical protein